MPASSSLRPAEREDRRTLVQKFIEFLRPGPDSTDDLIETLADAEDNAVIATDARVMLEGIIRMADRTAADIMVPAPRMDLLDIAAPYGQLLEQVIRAAHSRFPVYEGTRDNIIGVLMSKDLLKLQRFPTLSLRSLLRPASFVPETKGLYDLLRTFRSNRSHLSIVIDEFGSVAGLVTMEDVLEEIVGEIEDEFDARDIDDTRGDIFALADGTYRVAGDAAIDQVQQAFGVRLPAAPGDDIAPQDAFDTIGGYVSHCLGRVPRRGESWQAAGLVFAALHVKGGMVRWLQVSRAMEGDRT